MTPDPYRLAVQGLRALQSIERDDRMLLNAYRCNLAFTPVQQQVILALCDKYHRHDLAAECLGQARLWEG